MDSSISTVFPWPPCLMLPCRIFSEQMSMSLWRTVHFVWPVVRPLPTYHRQSADRRPTVGWQMGQNPQNLSADKRPTVGRLLAVCRPTVGRQLATNGRQSVEGSCSSQLPKVHIIYDVFYKNVPYLKISPWGIFVAFFIVTIWFIFCPSSWLFVCSFIYPSYFYSNGFQPLGKYLILNK